MSATKPRLRLLTVGPQNAYPPVDGGKEGIFGALQGLAGLCDVTYAFPGAGCGPDVLQGYAQAGVRAVAVPWEPQESVALIAGATARLRPYKFEKYSSAQAVRTFAAAIPREPFDAIVCFHAHTARLGQALRRLLGLRVPVLVREHNIEYELVASYRSFLGPAARLAALPFEWLTRREEQRIWARADAVAFLSDHDLAMAQASGVRGRLVLAREGIPLPPRRATVFPGADAPLLVLLNPKATQSVANLRDFLHRWWQPVAADARLAGTALHVTGVTTSQLAGMVGMKEAGLGAMRVRGLGFLPSLAPTLASSLALLSPTFVGGGIRKKILEAMAHQLPVIATRLDIDTCTYFAPGTNILDMGDDAEALCKQVALLRSDVALWNRLSGVARATVEQNASWEQFAATVVEEATRLINRQR